MYLNDKREKATPNGTGKCPDCGTPLIPKCGNIKIWHWAHRSKNENCTHEGETQWHLQWKELFPIDWLEVKIEKGDKYKRADILMPDGTVIELQNSPISDVEIMERELFYVNMIWIFNIKEPYDKDNFILFSKSKNGYMYHSFRWKHPRKTILSSDKPNYYDLGDDNLFLLKDVYMDVRCRGWGLKIEKKTLVEKIMSGSKPYFSAEKQPKIKRGKPYKLYGDHIITLMPTDNINFFHFHEELKKTYGDEKPSLANIKVNLDRFIEKKPLIKYKQQYWDYK